MAHHHSHSLPDNNSNRSRLLAAFIVTALFMIMEIAGGLISGSLALLADAGHMLTDTIALMMALLAVHFASRKPNARHTFGLLRLTTVAAFINAIALLVITGLIVWEAIRRFYHPQPIEGGVMMFVALAGLGANIMALWLLQRGNQEKNLNVRAAALHVLGDLLGSVGAIMAALVIMFTGWTPADPILSIVVCLLVLRNACVLLRESFHELLEGSPPSLNANTLANSLISAIPEVRGVHHIHLWQVGEKPLMTLHVQVIPPHDHDALLHRIHHYLWENFQITHATVQMEYQPCQGLSCNLASSTSHSPHHREH
mgnify:CR=1 FL=1